MRIAYVMGALLAGGCLATTASAAPLGARSPVEDQALISKVATYVCTRDDRGWHYMRGNRRMVCRPARPRGAFWGWKCEGPRCGWWHRNERRWHDAG